MTELNQSPAWYLERIHKAMQEEYDQAVSRSGNLPVSQMNDFQYANDRVAAKLRELSCLMAGLTEDEGYILGELIPS
ncbi:MAG: hypothetical protein H6658_20630 [Ardenticatenaceae bacterium]|nr:hypothetical protein [Ardenticatenaceae bacterium]